MLKAPKRLIGDCLPPVDIPAGINPARDANFLRFRELVFKDAELQAELLAVNDRDRFLDAVVAAGAARGFEFERGEVESVYNQRRREWVERSIVA